MSYRKLSSFKPFVLILFGVTASLGLCAEARGEAPALPTDPIHVDDNQWKPSDALTATATAAPATVAADAPPHIEAPLLNPHAPDTAAADSAAVKPQAVPTAPPTKEQAAATPAVAAPLRALDLPILPATYKGYMIPVDSTADTNDGTAAKIVDSKDGTSDLYLQEQNWHDAAEVARENADASNGLSTEGDHAALDVRMSFLPNPKIIPALNPERVSPPRFTEVPAPPKPTPKLKQLAQTPAECAAVDLYKKKQLQAIQSDRQTLQALQSAIKDLGLQKQLNFMAGTDQSQNVSGPAQN